MRQADVERFESYVIRTEDCWLWSGALTQKGYGQFFLESENRAAHKVAYELNYGPIPAGFVVKHSCDNRNCVRPTHLTAGTQQSNIQEAVDRGRMAVGALNGRSTMTEQTAKEIKDLLRAGPFTMRHIASMYGVNQHAVQNIRYGRTWVHLP